jgi:hypothetical protein
LTLLPRCFDRILSAQPLFDEIVGEVLELSSGLSPSGTLGSGPYGIQFTETTAEELAHKRHNLEEIRDFVHAHTELTSTAAMLTESVQEHHKAAEMLGGSTNGALLVARAHKIPLCTDDAILRAMAKNTWDVDGAGSQAILQRMLDKGLLSQDEYNRALVKLVMANYKTIFVNAATAMWALEEHQLVMRPEVIRLFRLFNGPECSEDAAVGAMAELTRLVWLKIPVPQARQLILTLILGTLAVGRTRRVFAKFASNIRVLFRLLPLAEADILQTVLMWQRHGTIK